MSVKSADTSEHRAESGKAPALKLNFLSHGTLESRDLAFSRRFYEEFLGLEVVPDQPDLAARAARRAEHDRSRLQQEGGRRDEPSQPQRARCRAPRKRSTRRYRTVCAQAEQWRLKKISKPHLQHGTYSFFFWDGDDNCWEILTNPEGGYSWLFEQGDLKGKGHLDRNFKRPGTSS